MSYALNFYKNHQGSDVADLMTALDSWENKVNLKSIDQDYENEATLWTFTDGSMIRINNEVVQVIESGKEYCTQNAGDCETCSLSNYGKDCRNQLIGRT